MACTFAILLDDLDALSNMMVGSGAAARRRSTDTYRQLTAEHLVIKLSRRMLVAIKCSTASLQLRN